MKIIWRVMVKLSNVSRNSGAWRIEKAKKSAVLESVSLNGCGESRGCGIFGWPAIEMA